jgi:hypothetical protein
MNSVVKKEPEFTLPPLVPQSESAAIISMIERMASDPDVDISRLEKILELRQRVKNENAKAAFDSAFALMQPELPVISEKGEIKVGNDVRGRYAKWEDIGDAIMPILAQHGFSLRHRVHQSDAKVTVTGILSHKDGHAEETAVTLPIDASGSKNAVQAIGSSVSYGQRYTARALLNIRSRFGGDAAMDDDGVKGGGAATITPDQIGEIVELSDSVGADQAKFLAFFKIERLADMPAKRFDEAVALLQRKAAK